MGSESNQRRHARMWLLVLTMDIAIGGCAQSAVPVVTQKPTTNGRVSALPYASRI
jgi:hypothetical protein